MAATLKEVATGARSLANIVPVVSYPAVLGTGFAVYASLLWLGWPVTLASYVAVVTGAALVTLHETKLPYRREWRPNAGVVTADAVFMGTVQGVLPLLLSFTVVIWLAGLLDTTGLSVDGLWPVGIPLAAQVGLMLLAADFPRYWLHRVFHGVPLMWRLHAVHHSPHQLYWLNVGRFHPIEKSIQYAVDSLPFALMGAPSETLAAYFVFYAINGFFQHSNCLVRLGPLNYVVSGPELHRWHHSEISAESNCNYGNNLILWDMLFGTRWLPADREVGPLGLRNRAYPLGFLAQMRTPFVRGLEQ